MVLARAHILVAAMVLMGLLLGGQSALFNLLFAFRSAVDSRMASGAIVVVAVDATSIEKIGIWPWPRSLHAHLIDKLQTAGAQDIAFDIDFSSPSAPAEDASFATALKNATSVILPAFRQVFGDELRLTQPLMQFREFAWTSLVNVKPDLDGIVRQYPRGEVRNGEELPSMAVLLAGGSLTKDSFYIDFGINYQSIPIVSYVDVLNENLDAINKIRGRKVIVGGTALELGDRITVAGGKNIPGPLLQALAAESLHQHRSFMRTGAAWSWLVSAAAATLLALLWPLVSSWRRASVLGVLIVASESVAFYLHSLGTIAWDTAPIHLVLFAYLLAITLDELDLRGMLGRISERRFRRITMSLRDALICTDSDGIITTCNPAAEAMFLCGSAEFVGKDIKNLFRISETQEFSLELISTATEEVECVAFDGKVFPAEIRVSTWESEKKRNYGIIARDISDKKSEADIIRNLAERDFLTGLANRYTLSRTLEASLQYPDATVSLVLFDLDRFKELNDTHGHAFGDSILKEVAARLLTLTEVNGIAGRLGGDEFAVVLSGAESRDRAEALCEQLLADFAGLPIAVSGRAIFIQATMGIASYPEDAGNAEALFSNADLALYQAKNDGRGRWRRFEKGFRDALEAKLLLEVELATATREEEFELYYQPQINLSTGNVVGAEALIRWRHPTRGIVSPGEFLPVLNQSALSDEVGWWVLNTACVKASEWRSLGFEVRIGVNLAPSQLQSPDLFAMVSTALAASGLPERLLEIEVTEDNVLSNEIQSSEVLKVLRQIGVRTAFDDFGTGFASLTHLKKFRLDVLKIDRSFVKDINRSPDDLAIVRSIISLGKNLGMSIIAEGIEDQGAAEMLQALGCDEAQGYYFGRPMPANEFMSFLHAQSVGSPSISAA